ncbi:1-deoxy-D-xylulose-5-phosphate reductoisomerase [Elusimicrobiota bacterium]
MNIAILGSTGSIGQSAIEVADKLEDVNIYGITTNTEIEKLKGQLTSNKPHIAVVVNHRSCREFLKTNSFDNIEILSGSEGVNELVKRKEIDIVINGISGIAGLKPTLIALSEGKKVAMANKESIVMAWDLIRENIQYDGQLVPVDSEHSAIFQSIKGEDHLNISKIVLTASGGAVYKKTVNELENITAKDCMAHPTWNMGQKITIDSATLMNKGLEVIEAHFLFGIDYDKIQVYIHPQSIIHGMVEFVDNTVLAHLSTADMKIPIQYALTHPSRKVTPSKMLSIEDMKNLEFSEPDMEKFPCLELAINAGRAGGSKTILLCAADEVAVEAFACREISFPEIPELIRKVLEKKIPGSLDTPEAIEQVYLEAKKIAEGMIN